MTAHRDHRRPLLLLLVDRLPRTRGHGVDSRALRAKDFFGGFDGIEDLKVGKQCCHSAGSREKIRKPCREKARNINNFQDSQWSNKTRVVSLTSSVIFDLDVIANGS